MSDKASRLLRIYSRLRRSPVTVEIIKRWAQQNDIDVSERTLYRDLKEIEQSIALEGEQVVVTEGEKNKKIWKIEYSRSDDDLTDFDIDSFLLFKNFAPLALVNSRSESLERVENLFYTTHSKSSFEKHLSERVFQITGTRFYEYLRADEYQKTLEDCIWSVRNKREMQLLSVAFDHTSISSSVQFPITFYPLQILYHRGCIHLSGFVSGTDKLVILALEQIKKYELTNNMFDSQKLFTVFETEMKKRFGITENMDGKVYDIEIEFSELTGSFVVSHFWHQSQRFTRLPNGNFLMQMHCGINREMVGWIFQWMSNARVVKPACLQDLVKNKLHETTNLYNVQAELKSNNTFRGQ